MGVKLSEQETWGFLAKGHTAIITTLRRDGWPVSLPVWYAVLDGHIYIGTPPGAAKLKRIAHDDRCSFLVERGEAWVDLAAVELTARAIRLEPGPESRAALAEFDRKYAGFGPPQELLPDRTKQHYAEQVVIRIEPTQPAITWDNSRIRLRSG